ncbi:sigma-70 family RNA polymerase sigma factor [Blastopirellula sp. JC732]|uniref:Sigma-70 family RNA polymerase sigma factor n=1 Tax=Blastopirellula sediminis TaxID=2894196 RepID=A0A9X1MM42_9BACT|nr:sigma-70 family RNA polymerase sigma factor [Blastopirellula sediminis]MCC9607109.1 sigma-70 family RNA polymerase sigma factor [Blastopirellula sediminis]MCC9629598.1 sigma-70 family RNA polymerase sigma factor [Blastopirellula sediminis]
MSDETIQLLAALSRGETDAAEKLLPLVYNELKGIAARQMQRERADHTLQPTALVHEAYLKLIDQNRVEWQGRAHFCAIAANVMRRILVDYARQKNAAKRGAGAQKIAIDEDLTPDQTSRDVDLVALDDALERLTALNPRHARIVELRYFGGLTVEETAAALDVSPSTVKNDWRAAKAWLLTQLEEAE